MSNPAFVIVYSLLSTVVLPVGSTDVPDSFNDFFLSNWVHFSNDNTIVDALKIAKTCSERDSALLCHSTVCTTGTAVLFRSGWTHLSYRWDPISAKIQPIFSVFTTVYGVCRHRWLLTTWVVLPTHDPMKLIMEATSSQLSLFRFASCPVITHRTLPPAFALHRGFVLCHMQFTRFILAQRSLSQKSICVSST